MSQRAEVAVSLLTFRRGPTASAMRSIPDRSELEDALNRSRAVPAQLCMPCRLKEEQIRNLMANEAMLRAQMADREADYTRETTRLSTDPDEMQQQTARLYEEMDRQRASVARQFADMMT